MSERPDVEQALNRLLGPAEPELGCDACFEQLDRYVELELAGADADAAIPGLRAHLAGCPACREEHDSLLALVGGLRRDVVQVVAAQVRQRRAAAGDLEARGAEEKLVKAPHRVVVCGPARPKVGQPGARFVVEGRV